MSSGLEAGQIGDMKLSSAGQHIFLGPGIKGATEWMDMETKTIGEISGLGEKDGWLMSRTVWRKGAVLVTRCFIDHGNAAGSSTSMTAASGFMPMQRSSRGPEKYRNKGEWKERGHADRVGRR